MRVDSGAVLGHTPLTITLPASNDAVVFRFEKPGYRAVVHRIIPDLEKSIRVDLVAVASETAPVVAAARPDPHAGHAAPRTTSAQRKTARAAARSANRSGDASKQFRSATPVNPFDM